MKSKKLLSAFEDRLSLTGRYFDLQCCFKPGKFFPLSHLIIFALRKLLEQIQNLKYNF